MEIGLAGWAYPEWAGLLYARGTPPGAMLSSYARAFRCVEMDNTYYATPAREDVARWAAATPEGFRFLPKLPKAIVAAPAASADAASEFLASLAPMRAAGKLGPILANFPPSFRRDRDEGGRALAAFLDAWPRDTPLAVELRHASWWNAATFDALREAGATHTWAVTAYGRTPPELTTREVYLRLIGDRALEVAGARWDTVRRDQTREMVYWRDELERLSDQIETVWIIANNHFTGYAPDTARKVAEILRVRAPDLAAAARDPRQRGLSLS